MVEIIHTSEGKSVFDFEINRRDKDGNAPGFMTPEASFQTTIKPDGFRTLQELTTNNVRKTCGCHTPPKECLGMEEVGSFTGFVAQIQKLTRNAAKRTCAHISPSEIPIPELEQAS